MLKILFSFLLLFSVLIRSGKSFSLQPQYSNTFVPLINQNALNIVTRMSSAALMMSDNPYDSDTTVVSTCKAKISAALETDQVTVTGAYDDPNGSHISIVVTSPLFAGKRSMQRQQLVYKAIWEEMQDAVHAVDSMVCKAPDE
mmetsp:Transcript_25936/g.26353  ORF Transcript_25936/g.26353 Transcript_25936/m.26353 type:complete len:143 (-) Transcript_25936:84-512(-)